MKNRLLLVLLVILFSWRGACLLADGFPEQRTYRIRMLWIPQAEFAGFYVAQADALYEKEGIRVTLDHSKPDEDVFESLNKGETDIVVSWPFPALEQVIRGGDIVNIGQICQRSGLLLIAKKDSGIKTPADLEGKRIGLWPAPSLKAPFHLFLQHHGIKTYKEFSVLTNADLFLYGGVDATVGVIYDDYLRIRAVGIDDDELVFFRLNDSLPTLVDDGLYCHRSLWENSPEDCRKILHATMEGWRLAFRNKPRSLDLVRTIRLQTEFPYSRTHQREMLNMMENMVFPGGKNHNGLFNRTSFDEISALLPKLKVTYEQFVPGANQTGANQ